MMMVAMMYVLAVRMVVVVMRMVVVYQYRDLL